MCHSCWKVAPKSHLRPWSSSRRDLAPVAPLQQPQDLAPVAVQDCLQQQPPGPSSSWLPTGHRSSTPPQVLAPVLPKPVSIYLCCADGTGQVERDFGCLQVLDVRAPPMSEDTASSLVEIFANGPRLECAMQRRALKLEEQRCVGWCDFCKRDRCFKRLLHYSGCICLGCYVGRSPAALLATPFTRECAELWVAICGQKPGPKPKEKAPPLRRASRGEGKQQGKGQRKGCSEGRSDAHPKAKASKAKSKAEAKGKAAARPPVGRRCE